MAEEVAKTEEVDKNITDNENVVRGVCTPYHVDRKDRIKRGAFKQKVPTRGVSVYRTLILSPHDCKQRARGLSSDGKQYVGLARVSAGNVRASSASVEDTREKMFYGHADIFIVSEAEGFVIEPGEPLPPELSDIVDQRIDSILQHTTFFKDNSPDDDGWEGPELAAA